MRESSNIMVFMVSVRNLKFYIDKFVPYFFFRPYTIYNSIIIYTYIFLLYAHIIYSIMEIKKEYINPFVNTMPKSADSSQLQSAALYKLCA